jgi:hypothetical protein
MQEVGVCPGADEHFQAIEPSQFSSHCQRAAAFAAHDALWKKLVDVGAGIDQEPHASLFPD